MSFSALGFTSDPKDLIPGEPGEFGPTIDGLVNMANAMRMAGDGLSKLDTAQHWSGPAADAFRNRFDSRPEMWARYGQVLGDVAGALTPYRDALAEAQREAAKAIEMYKRAQQKTEQARAAFEFAAEEQYRNAARNLQPFQFPTFVDPAEGEKAQAQKILDDAKAKLSAASDKWHYRIAELRDQLPEEPGWLERRRIDVVDGMSTMATQTWEIADGAASAVAGMVQMVRMVNPLDPYNMMNPKEYGENLGTVAAGMWHAATHPVETGKQMLQWDTWKDSPGRALGNLLPDILMTAATGGAGAAGVATRGALGTVRNAMEEIAEAGTRAATRHTDDIPGRPTWNPDRVPTPDAPPEWGNFGPRGSDPPENPTFADRVDTAEPPPRSTREQWDEHGPDDVLRPDPDQAEYFYGDGDAPPSRPEVHHDPEPPSQPEQPATHHEEPRQEPISRDELSDTDYRADDNDHAAYREQYGYGNQETQLLEEMRARNPEAARIPDEELLAINRYMGSDSQDINRSLWRQDADGLAQNDAVIRNATSGMNRLDDFEGMVQRGIKPSSEARFEEIVERYQPGTEVKERGFTSTDAMTPYPGNVQFLIESHSGKDISWVRDLFGGQREVAFPPYTRFLVESAGPNPTTGTYEIKLIDKGR